MRHVEHDGVRFRVRLDGAVGAPWMVFGNSLGTDLSLWDEQVAAFGGRFRILRYDQRGHGGTDVPRGAATLEGLAGDAAAIMEWAGVRDSVFVGCSMGAATGFALAPGRPELIGRLVASDGQAATAAGGAEVWAERIAAAEGGGMEAFADATVARWFSGASRAAGHPAIGRVRAMIAGTPLPGFVACARALQGYDFRSGLPGLRQATLLLAGAEDGAMPRTMRALAGVIPDARFVAIADAGHLPCIERPVAFNEALEAFLR